MIRWIAVALLSLSLQGCALLGWKAVESITVKKQEVARTPLNLPDPAPLKPTAPKWIVITPANADKIWKDLQDKKADLVLFALTDDGYEELSVDMAELRNFISQQREILIKYREYYEPKKEESKK